MQYVLLGLLVFISIMAIRILFMLCDLKDDLSYYYEIEKILLKNLSEIMHQNYTSIRRLFYETHENKEED